MDIDQFLAETGMSLAQLSRAADIGYDTLLYARRGDSRMKVTTAEKLNAYDSRLSVVDLLKIQPYDADAKPRRKARRRASTKPSAA